MTAGRTNHTSFSAAPHRCAPLAYNQPGHVHGGRWPRVAIALREYNALPPDTPGYLYSPEAAECGMDPWRLVEGADGWIQDGQRLDMFDVWLASGACIGKQPGNTVLYVSTNKTRS